MKIAIIGGSGFVGSRLISLLTKNHQVMNFDKQQSPFFNDITQIVNILDKEKLTKALSGNFDYVILLAAEHRDDVSPTSLYYEVNVEGTKNVLDAMNANNIKNIVFTSSVAIYGLNKQNPNENSPEDPFNHYGKSKWLAEEVLRDWYNKNKNERKLGILRPTVIFGERNRGNVYNLLKQISSGRFLLVGKGNNKKSMAYVGNIVSFIEYLMLNNSNYNVFNYVDTPDLTMNDLISKISKVLSIKIPSLHIPYKIGLLGGFTFDFIAYITKKKLPISSVRITKFCATTQFDASKAHSSGFKAPHSLSEGLSRTLEYEFIHPQTDNITFQTE